MDETPARPTPAHTPAAPPTPVMDVAAIERFLETEFPQIHIDGRTMTVTAIEPGLARLRMVAGERDLRPGGTVSGPAMFKLADLAAYVVILGHIGPVALAVTTNLSINFLRKPGPGALLAECRILKLGRTLATVDCFIRSQGDEAPVAHAVATYSIPPKR